MPSLARYDQGFSLNFIKDRAEFTGKVAEAIKKLLSNKYSVDVEPGVFIQSSALTVAAVRTLHILNRAVR